MLSASQAMKNYINNPIRDDRQYVRVVFSDTAKGTALFTLNLADMVSGSLSISRRSVGSSNFDIGQSYIDEAKFTVDRDRLETIYNHNIIGKYVRIYYGVRGINNGADEEVQIFTGIIPQGGVNKTRFTVEISLDSLLSLFVKNVEEITSGTPLALIQYACTKSSVELSTRFSDYITAHANNTYTYYIADDSSINTYLDLIMWLSQILGGAVTCNNVGDLDVVYYDKTLTPFILHSDICKTSSVSEDVVYYDSCSIVINNVETKIIGTAINNLTLQLTDNPLITNFDDEILRNIIINNIYDQMVLVPIRGFTYDYNGNPLIELGDYIQYNNINTFVQCVEYGFRKTSKLEGYTIDNRLNSTSQSVKSAAHSGGGGGGTNPDTVGILKYISPEDKYIYFSKRNILAEEYMALYAHTKALLTTTIVIMFDSSVVTLGSINIKQYFDNVELPMSIYQTVRPDEEYITLSFNTVVPESDIYETHQYRLEAYFYDRSGTLERNARIASIAAFDLETDIIGFMASGGQPTFTGAYFCDDTVLLKTSTDNVPNNDLGTLTDTVSLTL